jgi:hypothetical protein
LNSVASQKGTSSRLVNPRAARVKRSNRTWHMRNSYDQCFVFRS